MPSGHARRKGLIFKSNNLFIECIRVPVTGDLLVRLPLNIGKVNTL